MKKYRIKKVETINRVWYEVQYNVFCVWWRTIENKSMVNLESHHGPKKFFKLEDASNHIKLLISHEERGRQLKKQKLTYYNADGKALT